MENNRIVKRVYAEECAGSRSVDRPQTRWIDTVKNCLKKRGLDTRQVKRMVHDKNVWWGFVWGHRPDEPLTSTRCHSCGLPELYEPHEGWKSVCDHVHNLRE